MLEGLLRGIAVGAGAMFFLDPVRGNRRRALVRDQFTGLTHRTGDFFDKAMRDAQHRMEGTVAEATAALRKEELSDDVLLARVRSKLGRYVSHPRAIEVSAHDGHVVLSGPVLQEEIPGLLSAVWGVRGVRDVEDRTTKHEEAGNISDLQGGQCRSGDVPEIFQANWAPATRLFMGGLGSLLLLNCLTRRSLGSMLWGTLGCGLVMASAANCGVQNIVSSARETASTTGNGRQRPAQTMAPSESGIV
jgi:hypothetical protein